MKDDNVRSWRSELAPIFAALMSFAIIEAIAGRSAATWFCGGFIAASLLAFWESGAALLAQREEKL